LRHLFRKLIADEAEVERFVAEVVTPAWHFQHDAGRPIAEMVAERSAEFPQHRDLIEAYGSRFNETIPGPVPGSLQLVERLDRRGVPIFGITNFGHDFWARFRPTAPVFDRFRDIVVSGTEKLAKPDPAIFELAANRFGHAPEVMLFVDDNAANIAAAAARGWQVHHFGDAASLEADLVARDLL
jgi:2-haloacid dehalogenase